MTQCSVSSVARLALCAALAACGAGKTSDAPVSDAPEVRIDASPDEVRSAICAGAGSATVTGSGPDGSLAGGHVYARVATGFCPTTLDLIVTTEEPLAWPYLDNSAVIRVDIGAVFLGPTGWSGTFAATIARPDDTAAAAGTVVVDHATSEGATSSQIRATAQFDDRGWHLAATIDMPYCDVDVCF